MSAATKHTKVDTAYIERVSARGATICSFHICDIEEARKEAANLMAYHNEAFVVVIRNEQRLPVKRKTSLLNSAARHVVNYIKILQENSLTKSEAVYG